MKRLGFAVLMSAVAIFGATSCEGDNPVDPSQQPVVFSAQLSASNEVPPVSNSESSGRGTAIVTFNMTSNTASWDVSLTGFPAGARVILMHIHGPNGPVGVNQPVWINSGITAATGVDVSSGGTATINLQNVSNNTTTAANLQAVIANPSNFYVNVHTVANGGGAVRGQCVRQ